MTCCRIFGRTGARRARFLALGLCGIAGLVRSAHAQDSTEALNAAANAIPKSEAPPPRPRALTLKRCLELAVLNYPKVQEARARLAQKNAQLDQSYSAPYSDFSMSGGIGPAPTVRGTSVYSPDTDKALTKTMNAAWQLNVSGVIPLWTFGKITNLWDAARSQVRVGEFEVKKEQNDVRVSVRRAYYGVQLARDALILVREATSRVDAYLKRLEKKVQDGDGDDIDLLKLKMYRADLEVRESEAMRQEAVALAGLRFLTGGGPSADVMDEPLRQNSHRLGPISRYLSAARLYRPEVNMARAGVLAREAQARIERAKFFPDLAVGLSSAIRPRHRSKIRKIPSSKTAPTTSATAPGSSSGTSSISCRSPRVSLKPTRSSKNSAPPNATHSAESAPKSKSLSAKPKTPRAASTRTRGRPPTPSSGWCRSNPASTSAPTRTKTSWTPLVNTPPSASYR